MAARMAHLLLVEDDDSHAELISLAFRSNLIDVSLDRVADGEEALEYLHQHGSHAAAKCPDAILLDLRLPKLDGDGVISKVKTDARLSKIPIALLTTTTSDADWARSRSLKVDSIITKPFDLAKIQKVVADLKLSWTISSP